MNHVELETQMLTAARMLNQQISDYRKLGTDYAERKRDYAIKLSKKLLELSQAGKPATLSDQLAKGDLDVANARLEKDVAYSLWRAAGIHIGILQSQVDICRTLFAWEREERFENPVPGGE